MCQLALGIVGLAIYGFLYILGARVCMAIDEWALERNLTVLWLPDSPINWTIKILFIGVLPFVPVGVGIWLMDYFSLRC